MRTIIQIVCALMFAQTVSAQTGQWTIQTSGTTAYLYCVKSVDLNVAWIGGAGGVVLRTRNGGITWSNVGGGAIGTNDVYVIDALDSNTAFASTSPSATYIFRTTNGGTTWTQVYSDAGTGAFIDIVHMHDTMNGIAIGDPVAARWTILRTTNGGGSWSHTLNEYPWLGGTEALSNNGASFVGHTHAWFTTGTTKIYRSTSGGFDWIPVITPYAFSSIHFNDTLNGVAGVTSGTVGRSSDGGLTWTAATMPGTGTISSTGGTPNTGFFAARGIAIYRSTDGGVSWIASFTGGIGTTTHMSFVQTSPLTSRGWAVSSSGGIVSAYFGPDLGVDERGIAVQTDLKQNYPNPFNTSTRIAFALESGSGRNGESENVTLRVYDMPGREVATLVNDVRPPGEYTVAFDAGTLASGVYYCRLSAGGYVQTKKMILIR